MTLAYDDGAASVFLATLLGLYIFPAWVHILLKIRAFKKPLALVGPVSATLLALRRHAQHRQGGPLWRLSPLLPLLLTCFYHPLAFFSSSLFPVQVRTRLERVRAEAAAAEAAKARMLWTRGFKTYVGITAALTLVFLYVCFLVSGLENFARYDPYEVSDDPSSLLFALFTSATLPRPLAAHSPFSPSLPLLLASDPRHLCRRH